MAALVRRALAEICTVAVLLVFYRLLNRHVQPGQIQVLMAGIFIGWSY